MNDFHLAEFNHLREEILARAKLLHQIINFAILLWLVFTIFFFWLVERRAGENVLTSFLLFIPIIFALLAFNYQSNQMVLEAAAKYLHNELRPLIKQQVNTNIWGWEDFFARHKTSFELGSFLKTTPLLFPFLLPIFILVTNSDLSPDQIVLAIIDLALFILVGYNFIYKLYRVKAK